MAEYTVISDSKVYVPAFIKIKRGGQIVATVPATFDVSQLSSEYMSTVLSMLNRSQALLWPTGGMAQMAQEMDEFRQEQAARDTKRWWQVWK